MAAIKTLKSEKNSHTKVVQKIRLGFSKNIIYEEKKFQKIKNSWVGGAENNSHWTH
jgi:hypothetical protein